MPKLLELYLVLSHAYYCSGPTGLPAGAGQKTLQMVQSSAAHLVFNQPKGHMPFHLSPLPSHPHPQSRLHQSQVTGTHLLSSNRHLSIGYRHLFRVFAPFAAATSCQWGPCGSANGFTASWAVNCSPDFSVGPLWVNERPKSIQSAKFFSAWSFFFPLDFTYSSLWPHIFPFVRSFTQPFTFSAYMQHIHLYSPYFQCGLKCIIVELIFNNVSVLFQPWKCSIRLVITGTSLTAIATILS